MGAPDSSTRRPGFLPQPHAVHGITSRAFNGRDVKSKPVLRLERTTDVEVGVAAIVMTRHAGAFVCFAYLANLSILIGWDETEPFSRLQFLRTAKLDLRRPNRTRHVHPIVAYRSLQGFSRTDWFTHSLLSLAIKLDGFVDHFLLKPLLLAIAFRFLFVRCLGRLHQLMLRPRNGTEDTFVARRDHWIPIVRAHIAQPLDPIARWADPITVAMNR